MAGRFSMAGPHSVGWVLFCKRVAGWARGAGYGAWCMDPLLGPARGLSPLKLSRLLALGNRGEIKRGTLLTLDTN